MRLLRGTGVAAALGYAAPDAVADFEACRDIIAATELAGYLDDEPDPGDKSPIGRAWSTAGLWSTLILQARLDDAEELSQAVMRQMRPGGILHQYFDHNRSVTAFFRGEYGRARIGLAQCLEDFAQIDVPSRISVPSDPAIATRAQLAFALVMGGEVTAGLDQFAIALVETEGLPFPQRPFTQCFIAAMRGAIEIAFGDLQAASRSAEMMTDLGVRHGFPFWSMIGMMLQAMVELEAGDPDAAARADAAMSMLRALDVQVWQPSWLATLAAGHLRLGRQDLALAALDQAQDVADRTGAPLLVGRDRPPAPRGSHRER